MLVNASKKTFITFGGYSKRGEIIGNRLQCKMVVAFLFENNGDEVFFVASDWHFGNEPYWINRDYVFEHFKDVTRDLLDSMVEEEETETEEIASFRFFKRGIKRELLQMRINLSQIQGCLSPFPRKFARFNHLSLSVLDLLSLSDFTYYRDLDTSPFGEATLPHGVVDVLPECPLLEVTNPKFIVFLLRPTPSFPASFGFSHSPQ